MRARELRDPAFLRLLERQGVALVVADTAGRGRCSWTSTAHFVYVRLHGDEELYTSGYSERGARRCGPTACGRWAADGHDVVVYFDNDVDAHAPYDAAGLARRLGVGPAGGRAELPATAFGHKFES